MQRVCSLLEFRLGVVLPVKEAPAVGLRFPTEGMGYTFVLGLKHEAGSEIWGLLFQSRLSWQVEITRSQLGMPQLDGVTAGASKTTNTSGYSYSLRYLKSTSA